MLFKRGCELGEGAACAHAGSMIVNGEGVIDADKGAGAALLYEGCRLGHGRSCLAQVLGLSLSPSLSLLCVYTCMYVHMHLCRSTCVRARVRVCTRTCSYVLTICVFVYALS